MKRTALTLALLAGVSMLVCAQQDSNPLFNLLDNMLNAAAEVGRASPSTGISNPETPTFTVHNKTGFTIKSIFVSQSGTDAWGTDIFNSRLYNGQSARVTLTVPLSVISLYNIRLVDIDGDHYSKYDVEIQEYANIEVSVRDFDY